MVLLTATLSDIVLLAKLFLPGILGMLVFGYSAEAICNALQGHYKRYDYLKRS